MNRKKLRKYLGKEIRYTGKVVSVVQDRVVIQTIKKNNKDVCDHIITNIQKEFLYEIGAEVSFLGTGYTYRRKDGSRSYGLKKIHNYMNIERWKVHQQTCADAEHIKRRQR